LELTKQVDLLKQPSEIVTLIALAIGSGCTPQQSIPLTEANDLSHSLRRDDILFNNIMPQLQPQLRPREIFIYSGAGVAERSRRETPVLLESLLASSGYETYLVNASAFNDPDWMEKVAVLIMPGGSDLPYLRHLSGHYNDEIRDYVTKGGSYLGFCAGAYYASAFIDFDRGGELEVLGERELKFFPGVTKGPAYGVGTYFYGSDNGARMVPLKWCWEEEEVGQDVPPLKIYYNGGCIFLEAEKYQGVKVLARYDDIPGKPAAIIECTVGEGRAILSGVHPEFTLDSLPVQSPQSKEIYAEHAQFEAGRAWLLNNLLERAGVSR